MKATTKDLRLHSRKILNAIRRGEDVTITYRGKPTAVMSPIKEGRTRRLADAPAFGMWQDREDLEDVRRHVDELRQARY